MKTLSNIIIFLFIGITTFANIDMTAYSEELTLTVESENYIVNHYHDWTKKTHIQRWKMISTDQNPFTKKNNYAYIELIEKNTGKVIFKRPSTALTKIEISEDEKYIVGISKIKLWNPYQLIIYDINGNLKKKRNFSSEEAKLTKDEYQVFKEKFPIQFEYLKIENTYFENENVFIDFSRMGMPKKLGDAWDYLFKYISKNHLSINISESTTNWVFWFDSNNPNIKFNYSNNQLIDLNVNDTKGNAMKIKIEE